QSTLGHLVVTASLSDLIGSGAKPIGLLITIAMPKESSWSNFENTMLGVKEACAAYGVPLVGGDTKLADVFHISCTAIGHANSREELFLKSAAVAGDDLWISSSPGRCHAAVMALSHGLTELSDWSSEVIIKPTLDRNRSAELAASGLAHGGTDVSDGLATDLHDMCKSSKVGAIIHAHDIPILPEVASVAKALGVPGWVPTLGIGGDYTFLVTAPESSRPRMDEMGFHRIGTMTENPVIYLRISDTVIYPLDDVGHSDFLRRTFADEVVELSRRFESWGNAE
ncbi:MAG TPA: thiamine-monophosphate kinase, partial [candidate division Zixibacteria bacterium]|nr:thiamine-monophosphate kinase [candidate division Zixibacteria bacterium]